MAEWVREKEAVAEAERGIVMNGEREGKLDAAAMGVAMGVGIEMGVRLK